jgi:hypothetical protein
MVIMGRMNMKGKAHTLASKLATVQIVQIVRGTTPDGTSLEAKDRDRVCDSGMKILRDLHVV